MSTEEQKAITRRLIAEVFNQQRVEQADEVVARDHLDHGALPGQAPGLVGAKWRWATSFAAISDLHAKIDDLVAKGTRWWCATRPRVRGLWERLCIPPTGKRFRTSDISIYRLSAGKIVEQWEQADLLGLMQ